MQEEKTNDKLGYWEQNNRNLLIAAFSFVLMVGVIYFVVQSIIVNIIFFLDMLIFKYDYLNGSTDYLEIVKIILSRYKFIIFTTTFVCQFSLFLGLTILVFKKWHNLKIFNYFYYNKFHLPGTILSVIGIVLLIPFVELTGRISFYYFPILKKLSEASAVLFQYKNPFEFFLLILFIGVTPAICEEFLFRGYFQRTLQRKLNTPWHFIVSGIFFALFHQQPLGLVALIAVGIYLGFIFYFFRSIYTSIFSHFIYNSTIVFFQNIKLPQIITDASGFFSWQIVVISLILFLAVLLTMIVFLKDRSITKKLDFS